MQLRVKLNFGSECGTVSGLHQVLRIGVRYDYRQINRSVLLQRNLHPEEILRPLNEITTH